MLKEDEHEKNISYNVKGAIMVKMVDIWLVRRVHVSNISYAFYLESVSSFVGLTLQVKEKNIVQQYMQQTISLQEHCAQHNNVRNVLECVSCCMLTLCLAVSHREETQKQQKQRLHLQYGCNFSQVLCKLVEKSYHLV